MIAGDQNEAPLLVATKSDPEQRMINVRPVIKHEDIINSVAVGS